MGMCILHENPYCMDSTNRLIELHVGKEGSCPHNAQTSSTGWVCLCKFISIFQVQYYIVKCHHVLSNSKTCNV